MIFCLENITRYSGGIYVIHSRVVNVSLLRPLQLLGDEKGKHGSKIYAISDGFQRNNKSVVACWQSLLKILTVSVSAADGSYEGPHTKQFKEGT